MNELPRKVVLFLESLVTVHAGKGTMKGARFMSCYMGPILAGHLRDIHEDMKIKKQLAANNFEKLSWCENDVKIM